MPELCRQRFPPETGKKAERHTQGSKTRREGNARLISQAQIEQRGVELFGVECGESICHRAGANDIGNAQRLQGNLAVEGDERLVFHQQYR